MRRRRLGNQLRLLREAAGLSIEQVAVVLECSVSKVSRIETGQVGVRSLDLRAMLGLYKVEESRRVVLTELARQGREKSRWHAQGEPGEIGILAEFEGAATSIRTLAAYSCQACFKQLDMRERLSVPYDQNCPPTR